MKRSYPSGHEKRKKDQDAYRMATDLAKTQQITQFLKKKTDVKSTESGEPAIQCSSSATTPSHIDTNIVVQSNVIEKLQYIPTPTSETEQISVNSGLSEDIGEWPTFPTTLDMCEYWVRKGNTIHNDLDSMKRDGFGNSMNAKRQCTVEMFLRKSANGETIERKWLCYSKSTGRIYCFECKLFNTSPIALASHGFNDWVHASERLSEHEKSKGHVCAVSTFAQRADIHGRVDSAMQKEIDELTMYWEKVLHRLVSVIRVLSERGLAFRGDNQKVGSPHNGNYLGLLELIAEYDTFLAQHIKLHANKGAGHTNYLSSTICEELIAIMGQQVLDELVIRVKKAKYFSVTVDSSEDYSHVDQLTVVLRYLEGIEPVERFFTFLEFTGHKGIEMANAFISYMEQIGIDILDCRGQSYDNASNMSGQYKGMQSRIIQLNPCATFIPCFGHSLNLVGKEAASCCSEAVSFFDLVQALYVFFTSSTSRHKKLFDVLEKKDLPVSMPKRLSDTRWSCRSDAVKALTKGYEEIMDVLLDISEDKDKKSEYRCTAKGLYDRMCKLETGIFAELWNVLLERFNQSSKTLQSQTLNLNAACGVLQSLTEFVKQQRDAFDEFEKAGSHLSGTEKYTPQIKRKQRRNTRLDPLDYGHFGETELSERDSFRIKSFIPCIDSLIACLQKRLTAYKDVAARFSFLVDLPNMTQELLTKAAIKLSKFYYNDLAGDLAHELVHFQIFLRGFLDQKESHVGLEYFMYKLIMDKDVEATFPNTATALKIYLTLMVSNCSGERSFTKMKLIKNLNRTSMGQIRFTSLARMSIESDLLRNLDFSDIIHKFASEKARKVPI